MDSLTQFALGAGVGAALFGRRIGPRKAAVVGGILGTVPDLDVFFPFDDPVDSFILHRGATHSFFIQALAAPLFGEALVRLFEGLRGQRLRTYLSVYLIFVTHAIIDAVTIYGTRLFWPFFPEPVGIGSAFIIDPLYTLPLLIAVIWALCLRSWTPRFGKVVAVALIFSTAYLGWGLVAQRIVEARAERLLAQAGVVPERLMATPTPFNTLFWTVIAMDGDRFINLYLPLFGSGEAVAYVHPRGTQTAACLGSNEALAKLAGFSDGFYRVEEKEGEVRVSDLRMGLTPNYVFTFAIAERTPDGIQPIPPERRRSAGRSEDGDLDWLLANLSGTPALRPVERTVAVDLGAPLQVAQAEPQPMVAC